jgi:hypothetical protein
MTPRLLLLAGLAGATMGVAPAGAGESYPWCSRFADGAGDNCGFATYEQCMLTARSTGGFCSENLFYKGSAVVPRAHGPARRRPASKKD